MEFRFQNINPLGMNVLKLNQTGLHKRIDSAVESLTKPQDLVKITQMNEQQGSTQLAIPKPEPQPPRPSLLKLLARCLLWCDSMMRAEQIQWDEIQLEKEIRRQRSLIVKPILEPSKSQRKMLVLDLSRTLVFFGENLQQWDFSLKLESFRSARQQIFFKKRFGVEYFLSEMNKHYDLVVWSREDESFVRRVVAEINPDKTVKHILWGQHCTKLNSIYVKNLNLLGRKLKNVVLFTSDGQSAIVNPDNWVETIPFEGSKKDRQLIKHIQFLKYLAEVDDVRPISRVLIRFNRKEIKIGESAADSEQPNNDQAQPVVRGYRPWRRRGSNLSDPSDKGEGKGSSNPLDTHYTAVRVESLQSEASENEDSTKTRASEL